MTTTKTTKTDRVVISQAEWEAQGVSRFGPDRMTWRFVCPSCGHIASVKDWRDAGADEGEVAFSCVGRHRPKPADIGGKPGPCNYAGGGLFKLNPVHIEMTRERDQAIVVISVFEFAPIP